MYFGEGTYLTGSIKSKIHFHPYNLHKVLFNWAGFSLDDGLIHGCHSGPDKIQVQRKIVVPLVHVCLQT